MTDPRDAMPPARPVAPASGERSASTASTIVADAATCALPDASEEGASEDHAFEERALDDETARRAALRELAAMIGVEVFY